MIAFVIALYPNLASSQSQAKPELINNAHINEQIATSSQWLVTRHINQCFPEVRLDKDASLIAADVRHLINTSNSLFALNLKIDPSLTENLKASINELDALRFEPNVSNQEVLATIEFELLKIKHYVIKALTRENDLLGMIAANRMAIKINSDTAQTSQQSRLPYAETKLQAFSLPKDHSKLVFDQLAQEGFTLERTSPIDLLSSLDGVFGPEANRSVKTVNIPRTIFIRFKEGEFLLLPTAVAEIKEISDLLVTYQDLNLYISPEFEAIASPLAKRRMRSIRVKLERFGLSDHRLDNALQPKNVSSEQPCVLYSRMDQGCTLRGGTCV